MKFVVYRAVLLNISQKMISTVFFVSDSIAVVSEFISNVFFMACFSHKQAFFCMKFIKTAT